jgi:hypothetical protein
MENRRCFQRRDHIVYGAQRLGFNSICTEGNSTARHAAATYRFYKHALRQSYKWHRAVSRPERPAPVLGAPDPCQGAGRWKLLLQQSRGAPPQYLTCAHHNVRSWLALLRPFVCTHCAEKGWFHRQQRPFKKHCDIGLHSLYFGEATEAHGAQSARCMFNHPFIVHRWGFLRKLRPIPKENCRKGCHGKWRWPRSWHRRLRCSEFNYLKSSTKRFQTKAATCTKRR